MNNRSNKHTANLDGKTYEVREAHAHNSGFKEIGGSVVNQTFVLRIKFSAADSFVLRNRQLLKPANRYGQV